MSQHRGNHRRRPPPNRKEIIYISLPVVIVLIFIAMSLFEKKKAAQNQAAANGEASFGGAPPVVPRSDPPFYAALKTGKAEQLEAAFANQKTRPDYLTEACSQFIRWMDRENPQEDSVKRLFQIYLKQIATQSIEPRTGVLLSRIFSRINIDEEWNQEVQRVSGLLDERNRPLFLIQSFLSTEAFPKKAEDFLEKDLFSKDASRCREAVYFVAEIRSEQRRKRLLEKAIKKFKSVTEACQPFAAQAIYKNTSTEERKSKSFQKFQSQLKGKSSEIWLEVKREAQIP